MSGGGASALADPRRFAVDLHVPRREFGFLRIAPEVLEQSVFLDTRIAAPLAQARFEPVADAAVQALPRAPLGWLFHTSFCGSTLLARALHLPPRVVVLKEPLVLRRLADARHAGWPVDALLTQAVALLGRPWTADGAVVLKPTHAALNIAPDLLAARPETRGIVLGSGLGDFLVSHLKKSVDTLAKVPELAERALRGAPLAARLPAMALAPPDPLCAAALQWAAQRERVAALVAAVGTQRLRYVDVDALTGDPGAVAVQVGSWMRLPVDATVVATRAAQVSTRNAKEPGRAYDPGQRAREKVMLQQRHGVELRRAMAWAEAHVLPAVAADALEIPAAWRL